MAKVRNFCALTGQPNQINLTWDQPVGFNNTTLISKNDWPQDLVYHSNYNDFNTTPELGTELTNLIGSVNVSGGYIFMPAAPVNSADINLANEFPSRLVNATFRWEVLSNYSGSPGLKVPLFITQDRVDLVATPGSDATASDNKLVLAHETSGQISIYFEIGGVTLIPTTNIGLFSPNGIDKDELEIDVDGTNGNIYVYLNGTQIYSNTTLTYDFTSFNDSWLWIFGNSAYFPGPATNKVDVDSLSIFNTVQHTAASYTPGVVEFTGTELVEYEVNSEIIITKSISHFPMELENTNFPNTTTDTRPIEIFRGSTIAQTNNSGVTVLGRVLTDTNASFPTSPNLNGRLLRDKNSQVFQIESNTSTTITVIQGTPAQGKYIVLADFPQTERSQQNFESDIRTITDTGSISNLVQNINNIATVVGFQDGELANLIFKDGAGSLFLIKSNTSNTIYFQESSTPTIGAGMAILNKFNNSIPLPYIDNFRTEVEASNRSGSKLRDNRFYYYTAFTKELDVNVAQAEFSSYGSTGSTQVTGISMVDRNFGDILYNLWPSFQREIDQTGDLEDLMNVFGFQFNEIHALINSYNLQDPDTVFVTALLPLSEQFGLPSVGYSIGIDTLRRIAREMISCWKLKGSKEGISLFIKKLTTWDITDGTADFSSAISDFLPNVGALRFFDTNLGTANTRLTTTDPFIGGGRFAQTLPGIVIPGFFTFREFVVNIPNVALYLGESETFTTSTNTTTMEDTSQNFGAVDSLVGNFLLPNQQEVNDVFEIIANTSTTITVRGIVNNLNPGGSYVVLSPLNTNRFIILNKLLPSYIPFGTKAGFQFV